MFPHANTWWSFLGYTGKASLQRPLWSMGFLSRAARPSQQREWSFWLREDSAGIKRARREHMSGLEMNRAASWWKEETSLLSPKKVIKTEDIKGAWKLPSFQSRKSPFLFLFSSFTQGRHCKSIMAFFPTKARQSLGIFLNSVLLEATANHSEWTLKMMLFYSFSFQWLVSFFTQWKKDLRSVWGRQELANRAYVYKIVSSVNGYKAWVVTGDDVIGVIRMVMVGKLMMVGKCGHSSICWELPFETSPKVTETTRWDELSASEWLHGLYFRQQS